MLLAEIIEPMMAPLAPEPERSLSEWTDYLIIVGALVIANVVNLIVWRRRG